MFTANRLLRVCLSLTILPPLGAQEPNLEPVPRPVLLARLAPVPPGVRIVCRFEKGQTFYQKISTITTQTLNVMGTTITQKQEQTFVISWTPVKQEDDKSWVIKQKIEGVQSNIDIGGNKIEYDSTKGEVEDNPLSQFLRVLVGSEFMLTINPDLKVTKVGGYDEFVKKLVMANPAMKNLLAQILTEDALRQMADPALSGIPNKGTHKGDSWERQSTIAMGPIGIYDTKYVYTYQGPGKEPNTAKILVATDMTYRVPENDKDTGLPFKIKKADLKTVEAGGIIEFRTDRGRIEKSETMIALKGRLSIEIAGMVTEVDLEQTQKTTVATSDENPLPRK